jgi:general secretion pathway protein G
MRDQAQIKLHFNFNRCLKSHNSTHKRSIESAGESAGFTLFELMIVVAIIGTLTSIAVPTLLNYRTKAINALVVSEIKILEQEIKIYQVENMRLPDNLSEIRLGDISDPWGNPYQYLKIAEDVEDDEDNNEKSKGKGKGKGKKEKGEKKAKPRKDHFMVPVNTDFDLYSMGKDGKSRAPFTAKASHDDIVRANDGKFIGLVPEF